LAFSAVALASLAPKMLGSYRQRFAVYIWIGVMIFVFSYLVKVFKYKNGGGSH
jgi:oligosaccharyltransferase complex subunit gamma